ncbi:MAG: winged helix-turn-helix domain-containing protein [Candidatus Limnocylindrales bacterium]
MATPASFVDPGIGTPESAEKRAIDKLVLAPTRFHPGVDVHDVSARVVSDSGLFRRLLARSRLALVVIFAPPATRQDLEAVVRERKRRTGMRAVLVDEPTSVSERLAALRSGFDEAMGADIDGRELLGRLALLADDARGVRSAPPIPISADVVLDPAARELRVRGQRIHLRPRECALLEVFARHPGQTFSREQLLEAVGAGTSQHRVRTIDVHIRWLREKLGAEGALPQQLVTVRGIGYRFEPPPRVGRADASLTRR